MQRERERQRERDTERERDREREREIVSERDADLHRAYQALTFALLRLFLGLCN